MMASPFPKVASSRFDWAASEGVTECSGAPTVAAQLLLVLYVMLAGCFPFISWNKALETTGSTFVSAGRRLAGKVFLPQPLACVRGASSHRGHVSPEVTSLAQHGMWSYWWMFLYRVSWEHGCHLPPHSRIQRDGCSELKHNRAHVQNRLCC